MNRSHRVIIRVRSLLAVHSGAWITGLAVVWATTAPQAAFGQSAVWLPQGATSGNIYYNGGNVGIGTPNPTSALHVNGIITWPGGNLSYDGSANAYFSSSAGIAFAPWNGPAKAFIATSGNMGIGTTNPLNSLHVHAGVDLNLGFRQYQGVMGLGTFNDAGTTPTPMNFVSSSYAFLSGNVGIGTTNPQHLLQVAGTIGAQDVLVTSTGADYVFRPGYRLRPLSEVSEYIQANHHLPEIPSEAEVKEKGMAVGDMQAKLLAKIEELTLHMIQADERAKRLEKQNQEFRERIARLETQPTR